MVDISAKLPTKRMARAAASVKVDAEAFKLIKVGALPKGDLPALARAAGIMAAKKTPELIPLCHNIPLASVSIGIRLNQKEKKVEIEATAKTVAETGVEMEALIAASVAALTVYDMVKGVDKGAVISEIMLLEKSGGKSGTYKRNKDSIKELIRKGKEEVRRGVKGKSLDELED
jgi:cyclic pyranopterin phosphate synthase